MVTLSVQLVTTVGGVVLAFFIIKSFLGKNDGNQQASGSRSSGELAISALLFLSLWLMACRCHTDFAVIANAPAA